MRAFDVFVETVKYANDKNCRYYGNPWKVGSNKTYEDVKNCKKGPCLEMGINLEKLPNYKRNESKTYFVSTESRSENCLKYFSSISEAEWSNEFKVKPLSRTLMAVFGKAWTVVANYIMTPVEYFVNLRMLDA